MTRAWYKYLIYTSLGFLAIALAKADYLKIPDIHSIFDLSVSFIFLFFGFLANAVAQQRLMTLSGYLISIPLSISAVGLNMFGKYIPGKMWLVLGKAAYIAAKSSYKVVDLSILFVRAQFIAIWCGLLLGIVGLMLNNAMDSLSWAGLFAAVGLTLILFSQSVNSATEKILNKFSKSHIELFTLSLPNTLKVLPWYFSNWAFWGVGFYLMTRGITNIEVPVSAAFGFPLAGTLGILFLLAPGGIGVREGILVGYLALLDFTLAESITVAAASRLWFLSGEFLIFTVGLICDRLAVGAELTDS
jgi:hypothetical protein